MAAADWQEVPAPTPSVRGVEPLLVGLIGPPGSGKTRSLLRMMRGAQRVRPGRPIVLIDTEAGRSKKYSPPRGEAADPAKGTYDFLRIDLTPPFRSDRCLEAIRQALKVNPAAIGFDNLSDEHAGEGGYLEWHDEIMAIPKGQPGYAGGNEYTAWNKPSAARKRLASAIGQITIPMFFTFIAQEKNEQIDDPEKKGKKKVVKLGWMPIAPLLLVKTLDLTCILPYDSKGTPDWKSRDLPGEDFMRKWPEELLGIMKEGQLTEAHGEALARWAMGDEAPTATPAQAAQKPATATPAPAGPGPGPDPKAPALTAALATLQRLTTKEERGQAMALHFAGATGWSGVKALDLEAIEAGTASLSRELDGLEAMKAEQQPAGLFDNPPAERVPGEDDEERGAP